MVAVMRVIVRFMLWCVLGVLPVSAVPRSEGVAVLYNRAVPESRKIAELYQETRGIPAENLIALDMPVVPDISRKEYEEMVAGPLRAEFDRRGWWRRRADSKGVIMPIVNRIKVLVTVKGVPLRIKNSATAKAAPGEAKSVAGGNPLAGKDMASVDSELAMFGAEGLPIDGVLQNRFYKTGDESIWNGGHPYLVLTARIDAPSAAICERMIGDAVEVEKGGLWGMAYVDISHKYPMGDKWMDRVAEECVDVGIPVVVDRFKDTFPKNYPMGDQAAFYYGWYDWHASGPFKNPQFKFKKGAIGIHLHSFSAAQLKTPTQNWCAAMLAKGAAVTVGNVYEPYLHLTHDFGILHERLLAGDCWVEACWKAMPVTSWQGVVLGDPLYTPFKHLLGTGEIRQEDKDFRALRAAKVQWRDDDDERWRQLDKAGERTRSGVFYEAHGLELVEQRRTADAMACFLKAKGMYVSAEDKLRQEFHVISADREAGRKDLAIQGLRHAQSVYGPIPVAEALQAWLDILDPPPPPAAKPAKSGGAKGSGKKP